MTIWKFNLHLTHEQVLDLPKGAKIVHFGTQGNCICLWAEVYPEAIKVSKRVICISTGGNVPQDKTHIGTVVLPNQEVYHYYW